MTAKVDMIFATDTFGSMNVIDLRVGTELMHYKTENAISPKCLNVLQDHIIAANKGPIIHAWSLNSQEKLQIRMVCPGSVGCCAVDSSGLYIAVSTGQKLLIWQLSSGKLLRTVATHFQTITVIRWSQEKGGPYIVTGGEDGLVCVWKFSQLVSSIECVEPLFTFAHHSTGITDVYVGYGGPRARLFTTSKDKTCRIYDLATGNQLLTIVFEVIPTAVIVDAREERVFIGMFDGTIKTFSLLEPPRNLEYHYKESETNTGFSGHSKYVTCLALSIDNTKLVSGSADETIRVWQVNNQQLFKTIRMKGGVQNVLVRLLPESLQAYESQSTTVIKSFQKRYDDNEDAHTLEIMCTIDMYDETLCSDGIENSQDVIAQQQEQINDLQRRIEALYNLNKHLILEGSKNKK